MSKYYDDPVAIKSPVIARTRFYGQYINIQDLQLQLYRDASRCDDGAKAYILSLVDRLDKLGR